MPVCASHVGQHITLDVFEKVFCALRGCLIAGGSPAAGYFILLAQNKVTKQGTPSTAPYGVPCAARQAGRLSHKGTPTFYPLKRMKDRMHNSRFALRQCSPTAPGLPVLLGGGPRGVCRDTTGWSSIWRKTNSFFREHRAWNRHPLPLCAASVWPTNWGVSAAPCSSSAAGHVLCALLGRVAQTPNLLAKPKEPEGRRSGVAFFWLTFLGEARKVTRCRAAPAPNHPCAKRIQNPGFARPFRHENPKNLKRLAPYPVLPSTPIKATALLFKYVQTHKPSA